MAWIVSVQRWLRLYFPIVAIFASALVLYGPPVVASNPAQLPEWDQTMSNKWALGVVAFTSFMAHRTREDERDSASKWEVAASLANLMFLFPLGTIPGFVGLLTFHYSQGRAFREGETAVEFEPRAGDGTRPYSVEIFLLLNLVLVGGGLILMELCARRAGIRPEMDGMPQGASVLCAVVLSVFVHELGHVIGAWMGGFSVRELRMGLFWWTRSFGRSRFRMGRSTMLSGFTRAFPTREEGLRVCYLLFVACGPAGSLLFAIVCLVGLATAQGRPWISIWRLLEILAAFCLADTVCNLWPMGLTTGGYTDGARMWQLASGGPWTRHCVFHMYRGLSTTTMLSPAEWPSDEVEESVAFTTLPSEMVRERLYALLHYRLKGDSAQAAVHWNEITQLEMNTNDPEVCGHASELAFYWAFHANDAAKARTWLTLIREDGADDYDQAAAAVFGAEGDMARSRVAWERGWALVERVPANGYRKLDESDFGLMAERWFPDLVEKVARVGAGVA